MTIINRCPECKDTNISMSKDFGSGWSQLAWVLLAVATLGTSLLFTPILRTTYKCKKCGVEWK